MVDQTMEIIVMVIFCITMVCYWLAFGIIGALDYFRDIRGRNLSGFHRDEPGHIIYVTKKAKLIYETTKSHEEGQTPIIVSLLNDQYSV